MRTAAEVFGALPIGETTMVLDTDTRMPEKLNINYDDHIANVKAGEQREFRQGDITQSGNNQRPSQQNIPVPHNLSIVDITSSQKQPPPPAQNKKIRSLLDEDDEVPQQPHIVNPVVNTQPAKSNDPFDFLGLEVTTPVTSVPAAQKTSGDLLSGFSFDTPVQTQPLFPTQPVQNTGGFDILGGGFLGGSTTQPVIQPIQPAQSLGFDFLGMGTTNPPPVNNNNFGMQMLGTPAQQQPPKQDTNSFKFKAVET